MDNTSQIISGVAAVAGLMGFFIAGLAALLGLLDPLSAGIYCTVSLGTTYLAGGEA